MYGLRILKSVLTKPNLITVYFSLIGSIIDYGCQVFCGLNNKLTRKLQKFQNRCHYIICGRCAENCLGNVSKRREKLSIKLFTASFNPEHILHANLPLRLPRSRHFNIPYCRTDRRQNSFFIHTAIKYNSNL